jgi:hypothetical protein
VPLSEERDEEHRQRDERRRGRQGSQLISSYEIML